MRKSHHSKVKHHLAKAEHHHKQAAMHHDSAKKAIAMEKSKYEPKETHIGKLKRRAGAK